MSAIRHPYLDSPAPIAFAHRGGTADGLENTAWAFRRAADLGYRYMETDVHLTSDGVLAAFHDESLDRVTDARGRIAELPWSEVSRARVAGREPVPLFEELLDAFPDVRWNVDAKVDAAVEPLVEAVRRAGAWERVCVGSFSEPRLVRARALGGSRLATSLGTRGVADLRLLSRGGRAAEWLLLRTARRRGAVCVQVPERAYGIRVVDPAFLATAHRLGLQVHVWTINDESRMHALLDLGVDGIMTDRLEALREVYTARGAWT
ncbi:glycerophosphodiester phosphodiesterase [Streptomyces sp. NPDC026673]|uniref:glycerophosphodiester phosphodiesterase n=1 Tax=Streptomyces sp. NPDC026673 TaxID=3155724 RepID=UPI0033C24553